jgi:hypothetical protein
MPMARFSVDVQRIVHETIGDETILINLDAGTYHSLTGSGPGVWTLLAAGWTEEETLAELAGRFTEATREELADAVATLTAELVEADILRREELRDDREVVTIETGEAWVTPTFASYSDMQYLLLLDPIHDVTPDGWPQERPAVGENAGRDG